MRCQCQLLEGTLSLCVVLWVCSFHWLEVWKENSLDSLQGWGLIELTIPSFPSAVCCLTGFMGVCVGCVCVGYADYGREVHIWVSFIKWSAWWPLFPALSPTHQFHGNRKRSLTVLMYSYKDKLAGLRRKQWHPTPVLSPGKFHGWRSLEGYSPWGH